MVRQSFILFFFIMILASFISYKSTFGYNILPTNALFELLVVISLFFVSKRMALRAWFIFAVCIVYVVYAFIKSQLNYTHPVDFVLAFKAFIYLVFLCLFTQKVLFTRFSLVKGLDYLLVIFLAKYVIWIMLGGGFRPGFFTENNFEIMLVLFWALTVWSLEGNFTLKQWLLLTVVIFLSGSRSGVVSYFALLCILLIRQFDWKTILKLAFLGLIGLGAIGIFMSRMSGGDLNSIDRVVFFQALLIAVQDWELSDYLIGAPPLTGHARSSLSTNAILRKFVQRKRSFGVLFGNFTFICYAHCARSWFFGPCVLVLGD
ncbi:hypothetical protein [Pseudoalteromonas xiamenensis]